MKYSKALEYVNNLKKFACKRAGLRGVLKLLKLLNDPQNRLKYIHVAGTNGKGSVSSFCAKALEYAGFKVGLFTSPFVISFNERIKVNGRFITKKEFIYLVKKIRPLVDNLIEDEIFITPFDFITVIAIEYFFKKNCDIVVLEVGMGGRLDSTNVIPSAEVVVISHIDYDHVKELKGKDDLIVSIAKEKAGIIKSGCCVVVSSNQYEIVLEILKKVACKKNAKMIVSKKPFNVRCFLTHNSFCYNGIEFKTKLCGINQIENAMLSMTALLKIGVSFDNIKKGLSSAFIPARFEVLNGHPMVILDGAHNENGIDFLKKNLYLFFKSKKVIGVWAVAKTKRFKKILFSLKGVFKKIVLTQFDDVLSVKTNILETEAKKINLNYCVEKNPFKAVCLAKSLADGNEIIVIFGSLYLVSKVRRFLKTNLF